MGGKIMQTRIDEIIRLTRKIARYDRRMDELQHQKNEILEQKRKVEKELKDAQELHKINSNF
jgi:predicted translin family RNA/ssDNA-binding protein